jgi:NAD(P)-dependent dehydrogenase (short-subunit alcohol dehydrogenase family)
MAGRLQDKVVIITGAAGGQGRVAVDLFAREGARVVASDVVADEGAALDQARANGAEAIYVPADVTEDEGLGRLVRTALDRYGRIDALYNNHGVMVGKAFLDTELEEFDRVVAVNLRSVFRLSQLVARSMADQGGGSIIHVSSVGGLVGFPGMAAYGAAKGGLAQLTRSMATDLAPYKIRVNCIAPGVVDTPMPHKYLETSNDKDAIWRQMEQMHLLGRMGRSEEIVWLAVYLASDESSFTTGAVIPVDGGLTAI